MGVPSRVSSMSSARGPSFSRHFCWVLGGLCGVHAPVMWLTRSFGAMRWCCRRILIQMVVCERKDRRLISVNQILGFAFL